MFSPNRSRSDLIRPVATPKKPEKRKAEYDSPVSTYDSPFKRVQTQATPDRPVGITQHGLKSMKAKLQAVGQGLSDLTEACEALDEEIDGQLDDEEDDGVDQV